MINIYSLLNLHVLDAQEFLLIGVHSLKMFIACPFEGFDSLKNGLLNSLSLKLYFSCILGCWSWAYEAKHARPWI